MTAPLYIPVTSTIMADSLKFMSEHFSTADALFIKFNCLPSLHNQFHHLLIDVIKSSQSLRDTALIAKMELESNLKALAFLEQELTNAVHTDESILAERTNLPANVKRKICDLINLLSSQLSSIKSPLPPTLTRAYLEASEKDQVEAETVLSLLTEQKIKLQQHRQTLTEAIDALSQGSPEAINKNTPITQQSLTQLGMASPHIAVILLAMNQMKETISNIGKGIRFTDMVKQRDAVVSKITDISTSIASQQEKIVALKGKIKFINTLHIIDNLLKTYTHEYQHVIENFKSFTAQADADFQVNAERFIKNLTPISTPW